MKASLELENQLCSIISNYTNGNRRDAAKQIRALSKPKLAHLLIHTEYLNSLAESPYTSVLQFEGFIMSALDNDL